MADSPDPTGAYSAQLEAALADPKTRATVAALAHDLGWEGADLAEMLRPLTRPRWGNRGSQPTPFLSLWIDAWIIDMKMGPPYVLGRAIRRWYREVLDDHQRGLVHAVADHLTRAHVLPAPPEVPGHGDPFMVAVLLWKPLLQQPSALELAQALCPWLPADPPEWWAKSLGAFVTFDGWRTQHAGGRQPLALV